MTATRRWRRRSPVPTQLDTSQALRQGRSTRTRESIAPCFHPQAVPSPQKKNIKKRSLDAARRGRDSVRRVDGAASIAPFVSTRHCKCINNQNLKEKRKINNKRNKRCLDAARRGRDNVRGVNGEASITPLVSTPHSKKKISNLKGAEASLGSPLRVGPVASKRTSGTPGGPGPPTALARAPRTYINI